MGQISIPIAQLPAVAYDDRAVADVTIDKGYETIGIHGFRVAAWDVVRAHTAPRKGCRRGFAVLGTQSEIQFAGAASWQLSVQVQRAVFGLCVTNDAGVACLGTIGAATV